MNIFWICLVIVSVQSKKEKKIYPNEKFKLKLLKTINYTMEWAYDKFHPSVRLYSNKEQSELKKLKLGDNVTLICESKLNKEPCVHVMLYKKFSKGNGDKEYKFLGGPRFSGDIRGLQKVTGDRYIYPEQYESYSSNSFGCNLRFTMKDITPDDMGEYACRPVGKSGITPDKYLTTTLTIPHVRLNSTRFKEVTKNGSDDTTEKVFKKGDDAEILIVKSDSTKSLQYEISLHSETKPNVTFDGGQHGEKSPAKWKKNSKECGRSEINVLYQHKICNYTYTAKFKDFKLEDNGKSIRMKAVAKGFEDEPDIIVHKLKIVSKPEFECKGYSGVKKSQSGPYNISCNVYMNPISEDWRLTVNEKFVLYKSNNTMEVENNTLNVASSKIDEEYKLQVVFSTNQFDVDFLNDLKLKINAENEHGSSEKKIEIEWAGAAGSGCASIASHIFMMVTILALIMR